MLSAATTTTEMRVPSILSLLGTFSVIITYFIFPRLRRLRYIEIVFYIACNDFVASIGTSLGSTRTGSIACWFQGIMTNYNYLVSVLWTTVLTYLLYLVVVKGKENVQDLRRFHCICWGLPLIVTLLPLTTNTYGNQESDDTHATDGWCFISDRHDSPKWGTLLWTILGFYLWLWICIIFIIICFIKIFYRMAELDMASPAIESAIWKLGLYPLVLCICWVPGSVSDTQAAVIGYYPYAVLDDFSNLLAPFQGFLLSVVFFASNKLVRDLWTAKLRHLCFCRGTDGDTAYRDKSEAILNNNSRELLLGNATYGQSESNFSLVGTHYLPYVSSDYHMSEEGSIC